MNAMTPIRTAMSLHADPKHKQAARSLGYALTLGDEPAWATFTLTAYRVLTLHERAALAYACLLSLDHDEAAMTADAALAQLPNPDPLATPAFAAAAADYRSARDRRAA